MLLVLFNKICVHSYHIVLCWFLVSSLVPLIIDNDPVNDRCVVVTPLGSGLLSGFTADDRRLGLHSRRQVGVRVRVSSGHQGALHSRQGRSCYPEGCAHAQ